MHGVLIPAGSVIRGIDGKIGASSTPASAAYRCWDCSWGGSAFVIEAVPLVGLTARQDSA
jgi:hypothetical protein